MKPLGINSRRNNYTQCYTMLFTRFYQHLPSCTTHQQLLASNPGQMTTFKILKPNFTLYTVIFMSTYVNHHRIACSCAKRYKGRPWQVAVPLAPTDKSALAAGDLRFRNKSIVGYRGKQVKLQNDHLVDAENFLQNSDQNPNGIQRRQIF